MRSSYKISKIISCYKNSELLIEGGSAINLLVLTDHFHVFLCIIYIIFHIKYRQSIFHVIIHFLKTIQSCRFTIQLQMFLWRINVFLCPGSYTDWNEHDSCNLMEMSQRDHDCILSPIYDNFKKPHPLLAPIPLHARLYYNQWLVQTSSRPKYNGAINGDEVYDHWLCPLLHHPDH